jgi:crotonobetainyl-CoA:carnitine CoA-transferase CaiB-like acyl-CoA transferase
MSGWRWEAGDGLLPFPELGEHTHYVLKELGFSGESIKEMHNV